MGFGKTSAHVCATEEGPFEVEGYDEAVDGSGVKDDMEVFGHGGRRLSFDCDLVAGWNARLEKWLVKIN